MKRNKFSKALKHLKSTRIDEKLKSLEEASPTNNMSGVYQVTPDTGDGFRMVKQIQILLLDPLMENHILHFQKAQRVSY